MHSITNKIKNWEEKNYFYIIFYYFFPELITTFILYFAINLIDSYFLSQIDSLYFTTLGITDTFFNFITKITEAFSISIVIICGKLNGQKEYIKLGQTLSNIILFSIFTGITISIIIYFFSFFIYLFYQVPENILKIGTPYLKLRSISIFFSFIFFNLIGFLRAIKNTKIPMIIFLIGSCLFIFFDYILIFGKLGFQPMGLYGSAIANILYYFFMLLITIVYLLKNSQVKKYNLRLLPKLKFNKNNYIKELYTDIIKIISLGWPMIIDKAIFAIFHIWIARNVSYIAKCYNPDLCQNFLSSFNAIKYIEKFAILPSLAFAQVTTFLISNINNNKNTFEVIKKILILNFIIIFFILFLLISKPNFFIKLFDKNNIFSNIAIKLVPISMIIVLFDTLQLILSAALRVMVNIKFVMLTRIIVGFLFFIPVSYIFANLPSDNIIIRFQYFYFIFCVSNIIMSIIYLIILKKRYNKLKEA